MDGCGIHSQAGNGIGRAGISLMLDTLNTIFILQKPRPTKSLPPPFVRPFARSVETKVMEKAFPSANMPPSGRAVSHSRAAPICSLHAPAETISAARRERANTQSTREGSWDRTSKAARLRTGERERARKRPQSDKTAAE